MLFPYRCALVDPRIKRIMDLRAIFAQNDVSGTRIGLSGKRFAAIITNVRAASGQAGQKQQGNE